MELCACLPPFGHCSSPHFCCVHGLQPHLQRTSLEVMHNKMRARNTTVSPFRKETSRFPTRHWCLGNWSLLRNRCVATTRPISRKCPSISSAQGTVDLLSCFAVRWSWGRRGYYWVFRPLTDGGLGHRIDCGVNGLGPYRPGLPEPAESTVCGPVEVGLTNSWEPA